MLVEKSAKKISTALELHKSLKVCTNNKGMYKHMYLHLAPKSHQIHNQIKLL